MREAYPSGWGLRGGSSDAATTLIALNRLWGTGLSRPQLMALGLQLGADVPVFIYGVNAFADGIGEQLQGVDLPTCHYNIVRPAAFVSTADVFSDAGLTRDTPTIIMTDFARWQTEQVSGACEQKNNVLESLPLFGKNDLESIVCKKHKPVADVLNSLQGLDLNARMTGSGSCVFVGHSNYEVAVRQHDRISSNMLDLTNNGRKLVEGHWLVSSLSDHPLRSWLN